MTLSGPSVIVLAGPNGAGKSTAAAALLQGALAVPIYVNADVVAQGLAGYDPGVAAISAGRIVHHRLRELARDRLSFAFETTLARWLAELIDEGYYLHLVFLWLPNAEVAVQRVAERVAHGGHTVPEATVRRRYTQGLRHFGQIYRPLAAFWYVYDNAEAGGPLLVARGCGNEAQVLDADWWALMRSSLEARP